MAKMHRIFLLVDGRELISWSDAIAVRSCPLKLLQVMRVRQNSSTSGASGDHQHLLLEASTIFLEKYLHQWSQSHYGLERSNTYFVPLNFILYRFLPFLPHTSDHLARWGHLIRCGFIKGCKATLVHQSRVDIGALRVSPMMLSRLAH